MCTVLVLLRPEHPWPLIVAANRDERLDRAFDAPGRWWPDAPQIVAGRDVLGGGSWFGVNDEGVVATIVNGLHRLGPLQGKESRGGIVLRALRERNAASAARFAGALAPDRYRGFTLLLADRRTAFAVTSDEHRMRVDPLAPGHHMITPEGCDVTSSPRYAAHFASFRDAPAPQPATGDWTAWTALLRRADDDDPHRAMTVAAGAELGTVCSTLLALSAARPAPPVMRFAAGPPTQVPYEPVTVPWVHGANVEGR
ncbi:MAG: NRDE family protein [Candidatus Eremiobacteraeota bacterium]|nr:NRDE family protein [Candidatus Eremiobacteraeota bacterium]